MPESRNLNLTPRPEESRERRTIHIVSFELDEIMLHFEENIENITHHFTVADQLWAENHSEAAKDIWRSQILFLESALDFYIHEITKYGMPKILNGEWMSTQKFENFRINLAVVIEAIRNPEDPSWFLESINQTYATVSFMSFTAIKDQLNLIGIDPKSVADDAFFHHGSAEKTVDQLKKALDELYNRRNAIAHQSDRSHHDACRREIDKAYVVQAITTVQKIVAAINKNLEDKNANE
ncbi:HEPN domain-containing protein [uncultured Acetobacterium sp.]|uniref:HEPN domain-containing protein n=1 Tax=uncultured Acetobacterium sp. TaxID=217139 RepID=UPI0025CDE022|nr:HEPN domain-containing protein [uncultured Acetobacterium sp.]